jgi:hypothetical protein
MSTMQAMQQISCVQRVAELAAARVSAVVDMVAMGRPLKFLTLVAETLAEPRKIGEISALVVANGRNYCVAAPRQIFKNSANL